jgi:hypothetical protein
MLLRSGLPDSGREYLKLFNELVMVAWSRTWKMITECRHRGTE